MEAIHPGMPMRTVFTLASVVCVTLIAVLALFWVATGKENALLEAVLCAIFLGIQVQATIWEFSAAESNDRQVGE